MAREFLLLHGFTGARSEHWLRWLGPELTAHDETVRFPELPDPDTPHLDRWLGSLRAILADTKTEELVVVAHSCGSLLWLHHAAQFKPGDRLANRVLLVAPPGPNWSDPDVHGFEADFLNGPPLPRAARSTTIVAAQDDPYAAPGDPERYATHAGAVLVLLPTGQHLNATAGFGPWPAVREWCLTGTDTPAQTIFNSVATR